MAQTSCGSAWKQFRRERFERVPEFHYRPLPVDPNMQTVVLAAGRVGTHPNVVTPGGVEIDRVMQNGHLTRFWTEVLTPDQLVAVRPPGIRENLQVRPAAGPGNVSRVAVRRGDNLNLDVRLNVHVARVGDRDGQRAADVVTGDDLRRRGYAQASTFSWQRTARETLSVLKEVHQGAAFRRRERSLGWLADMKGAAMSLFFAYRDWVPKAEGDEGREIIGEAFPVRFSYQKIAGVHRR